MRKERPLTPWEGKMAFRRFAKPFIAIVLIIAIVTGVKVLLTPTPKREKLSAEQLATAMAKALLSVKEMTVTVAPQQDQPGGTITSDRLGNFNIQTSPLVSNVLISARVYDGQIYFRDGASAIEAALTNTLSPLPTTLARRYARLYADRWFVTGGSPGTSLNAPVSPTRAEGFFTSLGVGPTFEFATQGATVNANVAVIPLVTGQITWFVPASGSLLPNEMVVVGTNDNPLFNSISGAQLTYGDGLIPMPTDVASPPRQFDTTWNESVKGLSFNRLTPFGLVWLGASLRAEQLSAQSSN